MTDSASLGSRALGKASWRILPLVGLGYLCCYLDRLNVSFAATQMNVDLKFSATVYGLGSGFFFLTYALLEIPSGMVMPRVGPRRWMARIMISWGLLSAGMMFVRTPVQFYVMRLLLGAAEAGFWPTCIYYLTFWYPAAYRGRAISRFYCFAGVTSIVGGALSGWLLGLDGVGGLHGWQWLFLLEGAPTVLLGMAMLWLLPERPATSHWLADDERAWIVDELAAENLRLAGGKEPHPLRALQDPLVLQLAAIACLTIGGYIGFALIAPQVLMTGTGMNVGHVGYLISCGGAMIGDRDARDRVAHRPRRGPLRRFHREHGGGRGGVHGDGVRPHSGDLYHGLSGGVFLLARSDAFDQSRDDRSGALPHARRRGRGHQYARPARRVRGAGPLGNQQGLHRILPPGTVADPAALHRQRGHCDSPPTAGPAQMAAGRPGARPGVGRCMMSYAQRPLFRQW